MPVLRQKYAKGGYSLQIFFISLAVFIVVFVLAAAIGTAMAAVGGLNGDPTQRTTGGNGTISGCGVPDDYATVFSNGVSGTGVSPALIGATFYAGEHGSSWPSISGPWASNTSSGASGAFQFMPCTWNGSGAPGCSKSELDAKNGDQRGIAYLTDTAKILSYGGLGRDSGTDGADVQDINDAAKGAAAMFKANLATQHGTEEEKIKKAIYLYNHDDPYVARVYAAYLEFQICVTGDVLGIIPTASGPASGIIDFSGAGVRNNGIGPGTRHTLENSKWELWRPKSAQLLEKMMSTLEPKVGSLTLPDYNAPGNAERIWSQNSHQCAATVHYALRNGALSGFSGTSQLQDTTSSFVTNNFTYIAPASALNGQPPYQRGDIIHFLSSGCSDKKSGKDGCSPYNTGNGHWAIAF